MTVKHLSQKDLADQHFDKRARDNIHTSFPAVVTRVSGRFKVDVQPLVETMRPDGSKMPYPELFDVRVMTLSGMLGTVRISMPISVGDKVWVMVSERDVDNLMRTGRPSVITTLTHDLSDCFCIPCFYSDIDVAALPFTDDISSLVIGNRTSTIKIKPSEISVETLDMNVSGNVTVSGDIRSETSIEAPMYMTQGLDGASGEFVSLDDKIVTVRNGIIVAIIDTEI